MKPDLATALTAIAGAAYNDLEEYLHAGGALHRDALLGEQLLRCIHDLQRLLHRWDHRHDWSPQEPETPKGQERLPF